MNAIEAEKTLQEADLLHSEEEVQTALDSLATQINSEMQGKDPIVFCVMNGGVIPTGMLVPRFNFTFRLDYLHATRYREATRGSDLHWKKAVDCDLSDQTVLVVDDILDEGYTLEAIVEHCLALGAADVYSAVLAEKKHDRGCNYKADFVGMEVMDRYVFGMGMDYKGYLRHLPAIYAVKGL